MYTQNGWWFLSSGGAYPPVFTVVVDCCVVLPGSSVVRSHLDVIPVIQKQTDMNSH